jgi:hypothetical protein
MPPIERFVCRFAAEPPQGDTPSGDWASTLQVEFLAACLRIDTEGEELGDVEEPRWFPDRTWSGRTYVPVTARTTTGLEVFGYVSYAPGEGDDGEPTDFAAVADFTDETAERHPEWQMDICEEVVGGWRGEGGRVAAMTLVWGVPLLSGGRVATAELSDLAVDQCAVRDGRFTLLAPDAYRSDYLEIKLWDGDGRELASESLYVEDDEDDEDDEEE